jgi:hypothetical protein
MPSPKAPLRRTVSPALCLLLAAALVGCNAGKEADSPVARIPDQTGEVWEIDGTGDREATPAAVLAYINGLHVFVLDQGEAFAGMTRLRGERGSNGGHVFHLPNGLDAEVVPAGEGMELRFSSGESLPLRKRSSEARSQ